MSTTSKLLIGGLILLAVLVVVFSESAVALAIFRLLGGIFRLLGALGR